MHLLVGLAAVGALVWFAFGERVAQTVVGLGLAVFAGLFLVFVCTMLYVVHRDNAVYAAHQERTASCVKMADAMPLAGDCR